MKIIMRCFQIVFPWIFLVYFHYYFILKTALQRANITLLDLVLYMTVYFLLLLICIYSMLMSERKRYHSIGIVFLGWVETIVCYVIPFIFGRKTAFFMQINSYILDYLCIYGVVVVLYSVQLIYVLFQKLQKSRTAPCQVEQKNKKNVQSLQSE